MTNTQTVLREADNKVSIVGVLIEKELEIKDFKDRKNGGTYKAVSGQLTVETKENEQHQIRYFAKEFTKAGAVSKNFTNLQTVMNEYISKADVANNPELVVTELKAEAKLGLNEFYNAAGELKQYNQINGQFQPNRLADGDNKEGKITFDVEGIVQKVSEEFNRDGEETGRAKITLLVPMYGGKVAPMEFVVGGESEAAQQGKEYVVDGFTKGTSVRIFGDIINFRKVEQIEVEAGFGMNKFDEKVTYSREMLASGGMIYDEDDVKSFSLEALKVSLVEREKELENKLTQSKQQGDNAKPTVGFGSGAGAASKPKSAASELEKSGIDLSGMF